MQGVTFIKVAGITWSVGERTNKGKIMKLEHDGTAGGFWKAYIESSGWFRIDNLKKISNA